MTRDPDARGLEEVPADTPPDGGPRRRLSVRVACVPQSGWVLADVRRANRDEPLRPRRRRAAQPDVPRWPTANGIAPKHRRGLSTSVVQTTASAVHVGRAAGKERALQ